MPQTYTVSFKKKINKKSIRRCGFHQKQEEIQHLPGSSFNGRLFHILHRVFVARVMWDQAKIKHNTEATRRSGRVWLTEVFLAAFRTTITLYATEEDFRQKSIKIRTITQLLPEFITAEVLTASSVIWHMFSQSTVVRSNAPTKAEKSSLVRVYVNDKVCTVRQKVSSVLTRTVFFSRAKEFTALSRV